MNNAASPVKPKLYKLSLVQHCRRSRQQEVINFFNKYNRTLCFCFGAGVLRKGCRYGCQKLHVVNNDYDPTWIGRASALLPIYVAMRREQFVLLSSPFIVRDLSL